MININPNTLTFRESGQRLNNLEQVSEFFPGDEYLPIVVLADTLEILDGHHRATLAADRGHQIPAVMLERDAYNRMLEAGYDEVECSYAALYDANEFDAADGTAAKFGQYGNVAERGQAASDLI